jgi:hypothetical protein
MCSTDATTDWLSTLCAGHILPLILLLEHAIVNFARGYDVKSFIRGGHELCSGRRKYTGGAAFLDHERTRGRMLIRTANRVNTQNPHWECLIKPRRRSAITQKERLIRD